MGRSAHGARLAGRRRRSAVRSSGGCRRSQTNDNANFLPASAESTAVNQFVLKATDTQSLPYLVVVEKPSGLTAADLQAVQAYVAGIPGLSLRRRPDTHRRRVPAGAADRPRSPARTSRPPSSPSPSSPTRPRTPSPGTPRCMPSRRPCARPRASTLGASGLTVHVTGAGGFFADFIIAFGGIDGILLLRRPRRRLPHPAHRLPQPDPALRGAHHGPVRPVRSRRWSIFPLAKNGVDQPQRPEPGHPLDPRRRCRDRLRPAPRRAVQGGAARRRVDVGGDEGRLARRRRADRGERRDGRPRAALPAPVGSRQHARASDRWARSASRRLRRLPDLPARGPAAHRTADLLARQSPRSTTPTRRTPSAAAGSGAASRG